MDLWMDLLFGNWFGFSALLVGLIMLGMGVFFAILFIKNSSDPEK